MKSKETTPLRNTQPDSKDLAKKFDIFKHSKVINQLSVQKMKGLIADNLLKKSSSLANLSPFMLGTVQPKLITQHKNTTDSKKQHKKGDSPKSPKKNSYGSLKSTIRYDEDDAELKRRKVYEMPYLIEKEQYLSDKKPNKESEITESELIAVPQIIPQYLHSPAIPYKLYSESLSTTASNKQSYLKVHDFQIGKILGFGKFGHVYMARHKKTGFLCALKQINKDGLDQILQTQLIREIKIQMFLNHPNIVKMYTFFSDSTHIYLVLQLCSSGQLYNFLKKNQPVSEELAKVIIRQVCQGIDYIHQNHIIHRDLKPQNILYHNSMMKICDFGWSIATPLMRETFCGTPLYVSPQLLKRHCYNNKVDIWSLGIFSYELLVGQVPFEIFCEADYIKILKNEVKFPKFAQISEQAKDFIKICLEKDPEKRSNSTQLLEHPFLQKVQLINFPQIY